MILFVNGDKHTAGALIHTQYELAKDDNATALLGNKPHPLNLSGSWSQRLSDTFVYYLRNYAAQDTNTDLIQVTNEWLDTVSNIDEIFVIIAWNPRQKKENKGLIYEYHTHLNKLGVKHLFFDTEELLYHKNTFNNCYMDRSYVGFLAEKRFSHALMSDTYYGKDAHTEWAKYLIKHIVKNNLL